MTPSAAVGWRMPDDRRSFPTCVRWVALLFLLALPQVGSAAPVEASAAPITGHVYVYAYDSATHVVQAVSATPNAAGSAGRTSRSGEVIASHRALSGLRAYGVAADAGAGGFGALSKAGNFGVWPYRTLKADLSGTGLDAHHLIEQRFAGAMGQSASDMASVAVTKAEHRAFTNAWRQAIPYGEGTANATPVQIQSAARQSYADYPDILSALGLG